jgi:hypothetical protein
MSEADVLADLLAMSDDGLAAVILLATGFPATRADLRMWRSALRRLLHGVRREREREPEPVATVSVRSNPARNLIIDMLSSPEMLVLLLSGAALGWLVADLSVLLISRARARYAVLSVMHGLAPDVLACAHAYALAKSAPGGATCADYWIAARVPPKVRAAINAGTWERLQWWSDRLAAARDSSRYHDGVLRGLAVDGTEAVAAYPDLDLGAISYGPPLAIWPPPPSEGDGDLGHRGLAL